MISLLLLILNLTWAIPPIEGGKKLDLAVKDPKFKTILAFNQFGHCNGTQVSKEWIITSAHCVRRNLAKLNELKLNGFEVLDLVIHPEYLKLNSKRDESNRLMDVKSSEVDLAFIKVKKIENDESNFFPLISPKIKFSEKRSKLHFFGSGSHEVKWDGKMYQSQSFEGDMHEGTNEWEPCNELQSTDPFKNLSRHGKDIHGVLSFKSLKTHEFNEAGEEKVSGVQASALNGDSGGPVLEKDDQGNWVVTGVLTTVEHKMTNFRFVVENQQTQSSQEIQLSELSLTDFELKNWATSNKSLKNYPSVMKQLKRNGLLNKDGTLKKEISVKRLYDREVTSDVTNLATKRNKLFIESVLGKDY